MAPLLLQDQWKKKEQVSAKFRSHRFTATTKLVLDHHPGNNDESILRDGFMADLAQFGPNNNEIK